MMRRQLAVQRQAHEAQQAEQYAEQLERLDLLQNQLQEDHAQQQLAMRETAARIGGPEECYNTACVVRACTTSKSDEV